MSDQTIRAEDITGDTADLIPVRTVYPVPPSMRALLDGLRRALIIALGAIEDYLGRPRSIVPRRKRG